MSEFTDLMSRSGLPRRWIANELGVCERTIRRYETGETVPRPRDLNVLKGLILAGTKATFGASSFRYIDLFAGIGGLRRGFEPLDGQCVFTSGSIRAGNLQGELRCDHKVAGGE